MNKVLIILAILQFSCVVFCSVSSNFLKGSILQQRVGSRYPPESLLVREGEYPYVVRLKGLCGGTIINTQWVVTAAHCLDVLIGKNYGKIVDIAPFLKAEIYYNSVNLTAASKAEAVQAIIHHKYTYIPLFGLKLNPRYDIGLIKIKNTFGNIEPAELGTSPIVQPIDVFTALGWGRLTHNGKLVTRKPKLLRKVDLSGFYVHRKNDQIFCENSSERTNRGDSGGPLIKDNLLYGVVSNGGSSFSAFTYIPFYLDWINCVINEAFNCHRIEPSASINPNYLGI